MKSMIFYYSKSGKTENLAKKIQETLGSDILKVEPEKPYGSWISSVLRVTGEKFKTVYPAYRTEIPNLDQYDVVLIGYPIWAGDIPAFFAYFVKKCNLQGKTVIPFATSGGSGIEPSVKTIKRICPESNVMLQYRYIPAKNDEFEQWLQSLSGFKN